jgi:hypothetical protein
MLDRMQQSQADDVFCGKATLTNGIYLANTPNYENFERTYCGGNAHGQDGVTVRR